MSEITLTTRNVKKNFTPYLNETVGHDGTVADRCQRMLDVGIAHYKAHGDSRYLAELQNGGFRATRTDAFRAYTVAHTNLKIAKVDPANPKSDLKYVKDEKSSIKVAKGDKGGVIAITINPLTKKAHTWDTFTPEKIQLPFDIDSRVKSLITQCRNAVAGKDGRTLKGSKKHANDQIAALEALVA